MNPYEQQQITTASAGQLTLMLYDRALTALDRSERAIPAGDIETANAELLRAQDIVTELQLTLNFEDGGAIAERLSELYDYVNGQLIEANRTKSTEPLSGARAVLSTLRDTWAQILSPA